MVRAKFEVVRNEGGTIRMMPVTSGSPENESFFKWTPWGAIEIGTVNDQAIAELIVGKRYYVDFTLAEQQ